MFFFFRKEMKWKTLSFLPVIIYVLFQLFFLKRAPTARAFGFVALAASMQIFSNKLFRASTIFRILFAVLLMGLVIANLPEELVDRFKTEDTARQEESADALRSFNPLEHIFGRGLGGWYELSDGPGVIENFFGPEKKSGKSTTHIGIVYVYLKGGLILFILILLHVLILILRGFFRFKKFGKLEQMSWIYLVIYSIFRLIEGPMSSGAIFDACLFGLAIGRLDFSMRTPLSKELVSLSDQNRIIGQQN
jgi:hypothetical protein